MSDCGDWIPQEITDSEEFLDEELEKLRDYVLHTRQEDISAQLFIYENRVLYSSNGAKAFEQLQQIIHQGEPYNEIDFYGENNAPIGWEAIRSYPYDEFRVKGELCHKIDKREIKKCFLMGWLEVQLWDRGCHKEQRVYHAPENIGIAHDKTGQFIADESVLFSIDLMKNYWDSYLKLRPQHRNQRPRFVNQALSVSRNNTWSVFVTSDLRNYYYSEDENVKNSCTELFFPLQRKMMTINCQKATETRHAVIANYDSWQAYLHALSCERGQQMSEKNTILEKIYKIQTEARGDQAELSDDVKKILKKTASETGSSGLTHKEKEFIRYNSKASAKIRLMFRMAQMEFVRSQIGKHLFEKAQKAENKQGGLLESFIHWISPLWQPFGAGELATAADIPEQKYAFVTAHGTIEMSCSWYGEYRNQPAYIRIVWKAHIATECELVARFVNPETNLIRCEIRLGKYRTGTETITQDELGFDPSNEKWAVAILLLNIEE